MTRIEVLQRCLELTRASHDSDWSCLNAQEIAAILEQEINVLQNGFKADRDELKMLFAPTGPLQETAMANNWSNEYLELSKVFDELIDKPLPQ
jgi:predicted aconitase